ncbi:hypothetical protein FKM82_027834, partial [Ascaphus truei]
STMFRKKKKKRPEISAPLNFQHRVHTSFDPRAGKFVGLPPQWQNVLDTLRRPKPVVDPSRITPVQLKPMKTFVRGSTFGLEGYISGMLNDIQKLSATSSNTLRGRSPPTRRRAQSLGLIGEERPYEAQFPAAEQNTDNSYGNYINCNGGSKSSRRQTMWPDYNPTAGSQSHTNGSVFKAQPFDPTSFKDTVNHNLQQRPQPKPSPARRLRDKSAGSSFEEEAPRTRQSPQEIPGALQKEGTVPKPTESVTKHGLFRSVFMPSSNGKSAQKIK